MSDQISEMIAPIRIDIEELLESLPAGDYLRLAVEAQVALFRAREHPEAGHDRIDYLVAMKALTRVVSRELNRRRSDAPAGLLAAGSPSAEPGGPLEEVSERPRASDGATDQGVHD